MERASWLVVIATVGMAFKGVWARLAYEDGATVASVLGTRLLWALPLFWLGVVGLFKLGIGRPARRPRPSELLIALACGALFLCAAICDFSAIDRIGAGLSRVILFSFPGFVVLIEAVLKRRWPSPRSVLGFGIAWAGLWLVGGLSRAQSAADLAGFGLALGSAVLYAVYLSIAQRVTHRLGGPLFAALSNTGATLLAAVLAPDFFRGGAMPGRASLWVGLMVVISTVLPFFLLFEGVRRIGAERASLLALLGPPVTLLAARLLLNETISGAQICGVGLVMVGVLVIKAGR